MKKKKLLSFPIGLLFLSIGLKNIEEIYLSINGDGIG
jgi:hypothetical protein